MAEVNALKLSKEWHFAQFNEEIPEANINMVGVKHTVKDLKWTPVGSRGVHVQDLTREVEITESHRSNPHGAAALGQVHASKESQDIITVTMQNGVLKGFNRLIQLPVNKNEVAQIFGEHIEVDPSKPRSVTKENKLKLDMGLEQTLGPKGAKAVIHYKANEYSAIFDCKIVLKGNVAAAIRGSYSQQQFSQIVTDLKSRYVQRGDLAALTVDGDNVVLSMKGQVDFRWESDHSLKWKQMG